MLLLFRHCVIARIRLNCNTDLIQYIWFLFSAFTLLNTAYFIAMFVYQYFIFLYCQDSFIVYVFVDYATSYNSEIPCYFLIIFRSFSLLKFTDLFATWAWYVSVGSILNNRWWLGQWRPSAPESCQYPWCACWQRCQYSRRTAGCLFEGESLRCCTSLAVTICWIRAARKQSVMLCALCQMSSARHNLHVVNRAWPQDVVSSS